MASILSPGASRLRPRMYRFMNSIESIPPLMMLYGTNIVTNRYKRVCWPFRCFESFISSCTYIHLPGSPPPLQTFRPDTCALGEPIFRKPLQSRQVFGSFRSRFYRFLASFRIFSFDLPLNDIMQYSHDD
jgi:hypothetical protein